MREKGRFMSEITMVPVTPCGIEKKAFKAGSNFIGDTISEGAKRYCYNILYRNECDPADNVHRFTLMPENATFITIDAQLTTAGVDVSVLNTDPTQLLEMLPDSMKKDIWGAWYNVDCSKRPLVRLYTDNVSKLVNGQVQKVHSAGEPMHKKGPKGETNELAVIETLPVWGFLKKNPEGKAFWLKGNDPMTRIDREINQGRMAYLDTLIAVTPDPGLDSGEPGAEKTESKKEAPKKEVIEAPDLEQLG